jgi:acyl carrier protein
MTLMRSLAELIEARLAGRAGSVSVTETTPLIEGGLIDSIALAEIVAHIEEQTGIRVPDDEVTPDNFASVATINAMVSRLEAQRQR